jgi:hypothetical protein
VSSSRAGSARLVIPTELKTELGSARYPNESSRVEPATSRASYWASSFLSSPSREPDRWGPRVPMSHNHKLTYTSQSPTWPMTACWRLPWQVCSATLRSSSDFAPLGPIHAPVAPACACSNSDSRTWARPRYPPRLRHPRRYLGRSDKVGKRQGEGEWEEKIRLWEGEVGGRRLIFSMCGRCGGAPQATGGRTVVPRWRLTKY